MTEGDIIICIDKIQHATIGNRYWTGEDVSVVTIKSDDGHNVTLKCSNFISLIEQRNKKINDIGI